MGEISMIIQLEKWKNINRIPSTWSHFFVKKPITKKELFDLIIEKEWNFKGFDLESANSTLDALIFKYSAPFTQVDGKMGAIFDGGTLHGKEINGIPGPETARKILSTYASPSFILERTVRPEKRILLIRGWV